MSFEPKSFDLPPHGRLFVPIERSLYFGRLLLGTFIQTKKRTYQSFDENRVSLGTFIGRAKALAAIRDAAEAVAG